MSILAAPRRKQRISVDPQNVTWKRETGTIAHKLMSNMGWQDGGGLGANGQGITENVKLKANFDARGLGCSSDSDRNWMNHHDDFAHLLDNLNKKKKKTEENKEKESLEDTSNKSRARIHYHKFTRGKDLARYSTNDKISVFGGTKKKTIAIDEPISERDDEDEGGKTTTSALSMNDYFQSKMTDKLRSLKRIDRRTLKEDEEQVKKHKK